jgi:hypothetical protein
MSTVHLGISCNLSDDTEVLSCNLQCSSNLMQSARPNSVHNTYHVLRSLAGRRVPLIGAT